MSAKFKPTILQWLDWALQATEEAGSEILSCKNLCIRHRGTGTPPDAHGAYVQMGVEGVPLYLGLLSSKAGCKDMARALLRMKPEEADPCEEDIADAVGEIANIFAGLMAQKLVNEFPTIKLEMPLFVTGRSRRSGQVESALADIRFDHIDAHVVIVRSLGMAVEN